MPHPTDPAQALAEVRFMLQNVVCSLVDKPDDVTITLREETDRTVFELHTSEVGKVIGKQGRTARSLRVILTANANRLKKTLALDIVEPDGSIFQ